VIGEIMKVLVLMTLFALTSCGGSGAGTDAPSGNLSVTSQALNTLEQAIDNAAVISSGQSSSFLSTSTQIFSGPEATIGAAWTNASAVGDLSNVGTSSYQEYMGDAMNPSFTNNNGARVTVFGRFKNTKELVCMLAELISSVDENGLPNAGSYDVTPTTQAAESCGMEPSDIESITSVQATVTVATDTTTYDKKIVLSGYASSTQTFAMTVLIRKTDTIINIATSEDQRVSGNTASSRVVASYDITNSILRFEYISANFDADDSGGVEFYRIYNDEANGDVKLLGHYGANDNSNYVQYTLAGDPTDTSKTVALSLRTSGNTVNVTGEACVNPSDGSIDTDGSLACGATGTLVVAGATTMIENWRSANVDSNDSNATTNLESHYNISESLTIPFTDGSDIYSATPN
jgi:hypothetical protein